MFAENQPSFERLVWFYLFKVTLTNIFGVFLLPLLSFKHTKIQIVYESEREKETEREIVYVWKRVRQRHSQRQTVYMKEREREKVIEREERHCVCVYGCVWVCVCVWVWVCVWGVCVCGGCQERERERNVINNSKRWTLFFFWPFQSKLFFPFQSNWSYCQKPFTY